MPKLITVASRSGMVCVLLLLLIIWRPFQSQARDAPPSSTSSPVAQPGATNTPLAIIIFTPAPSRTPLRTISALDQLPHAMSATPAPTRQRSPTPMATATLMKGLDPTNQTLLDNAVAAAFNSTGLRFSVNLEISAKVDGGQGGYRYEIVGSVAHLDNLALTAFQAEFTLVNALGATEKSASIEMRVVNGILYFRRINPDTGQTAPWGGITLQDLVNDQFGDIVTALMALNPISGGGHTSVVATSNTPDLTELLWVGAFIGTHRVDSGTSDIAQFQTDIDLNQLLASKETLVALLKIVGRVGGLPISGLPVDAASIDQAVSLFLLMRPLLLPNITLFITTEIDTQQHTLSRVGFNLSAQLNANFNDPQKLLQGDFGTVEAQGTLELSDYSAVIIIDVPTSVTMLHTLSSIPKELIVFDPA